MSWSEHEMTAILRLKGHLGTGAIDKLVATTIFHILNEEILDTKTIEAMKSSAGLDWLKIVKIYTLDQPFDSDEATGKLWQLLDEIHYWTTRTDLVDAQTLLRVLKTYIENNTSVTSLTATTHRRQQ